MTKRRGRPLVLTERGRKYTIYCTPAEREAIRSLLESLRAKPSKNPKVPQWVEELFRL